jgi:putative chromate ion transporter
VEPRSVSLTEAFRFWLKLGFISFGGPTGQIAIMHQELVERRRWISENRFLHALNYCMLLPGPEATQLATYIGWMMHRTWGGIVAGGLFVLPSVFILIALSWIYMAYGGIVWVSGLFYGIKPAVVAIVLAAAHRIGSRALKNAWLWSIAAAAFVAIFALDAPFPAIVITAAAIGYLGGRYAPERFTAGSAHAAANKEYGPAIIDDDTPTPAHALFSWPKLWGYAAAGVALWAVAIGVLYGLDKTLFEMGWFFTKAALLTFGGAYAVLPYVYQGAVENYGWLSATQMIDGLALGETTPGPLIMVVAFVGFVRRRRARRRGHRRGAGGDLLHLPALVRVHPGRRSFHRDDARQARIHRSAHRDHRGGGRRGAQPRRVLRLSRALAAGTLRAVRLVFGCDRRGRLHRPVPLQGRCHPGDRRVRADRLDRHSRRGRAVKRKGALRRPPDPLLLRTVQLRWITAQAMRAPAFPVGCVL